MVSDENEVRRVKNFLPGSRPRRFFRKIRIKRTHLRMTKVTEVRRSRLEAREKHSLSRRTQTGQVALGVTV